jgi:hypothetical protein
MFSKKRKIMIPEPPAYGPEDFGFPSIPKETEKVPEHTMKKSMLIAPDPRQLPDYPKDFSEVPEIPEEVKHERWQNRASIEHNFNRATGRERFKDVFKNSPEKPIFIKVEKFREIVENIIEIEKRLEELENIIGKLQEIKQNEEEKMDNWHQNIQDIKQKLNVLEENFSNKI